MADFGDDVGDMLIRHTDDFIRRLIQYRQKAAKGQNETESKSSSITIQGENEAAAVAKALTDKGIPFEITRTSLNVEQNGELGSRFQFRFAEADLPNVQATVSEALEQYKAQMREVMPALGQCSISIDDAAQAERIAHDLESAGIPYEVRRTALNLNTRMNKDGEKVSSLSERTEFTFSEKDFDAVKGVVSQSVNGRGSHEASAPEQHLVYMRDIEKIVDDALSKTQDPQQFIALCREQGLEVGQAADGTLKFTHSNGWFECRADTLFERMENGMNREDFERGVGEKAEDLSQHVVEEQERYIKSHDSQDLDTSTRVVEQPEKVKADRSAKEQDKGYDLNSEARDMRAASKALDTDRAAKEIAPQER